MTPRDRRALVIGACLVGMAVVLLRVVPWAVRTSAGARERLAQKQAMIDDTRQLIGRESQLRDSLAVVLASMLDLAPRFLDGRSSAEAAASLRSLLAGRATEARVRLTRFDMMTDSSAGELRPVRARLEVEGDIRGVVRLLRLIETGAPLLTVSGLSIVASDAIPRPGISELLRAGFDLSGWYLAVSGS